MGTMRFHDYLNQLGAKWFLYANASNAFKDCLVWLAASSKRDRPEVVMPSFIPAKLYRTALAAGYAVRFYEVHGGCRFELDEVERLLNQQTAAIFYVHYFGFPGDVEGMSALARGRGIPLIEDCALTVGGKHRGRDLGTYGDMALFSMRKMFHYPEGGALVVSDRYRDFRPTYQSRVSSCYSLAHYLRQRAKMTYDRLTGGALPFRVIASDQVGYIDMGQRQTLSIKMLSAFSEHRLKFIDLDRVVQRRRDNYRAILDRFPRSPLAEPMFQALPDGCTPYSFPMLVHHGQRDALRRELSREGVRTGAGWPESPFDPALARTRSLSQSLLELPLNHLLTRRQVDRSLRILERVVRSKENDR
jgi:dTDP-4-amino-4,6-dideoxygalactose transaminase